MSSNKEEHGDDAPMWRFIFRGSSASNHEEGTRKESQKSEFEAVV